MADEDYSRFRKAYCIRFDGGTKIAWSSSSSFDAGGYKKLSDAQVKMLAEGTHLLRSERDENDREKSHLNLLGPALEKTRDAIFRWPKDGIRVDQHVYALQHQIMSLKEALSRAQNDYGFALSKYDEERMSAKERTQSMREQANLQREVSTLSVQFHQKQAALSIALRTRQLNLTLRDLRVSTVGKLRRELEDLLRQSLDQRFCDELFRVMWSNDALQCVRFCHMRLSKKEPGLIAWLLNHFRTKELVAKHCCLTSESIFGIVQMCRIQPQQQCLVTLDLGFNRIGFAGVQNIAKMLEKNATLTTLGLAGNRIDTAGAEVLSASLRKNETLLHLNLFMNDLDIGGACAISEYLRDTKSLLSLNIRSNHIYPEGASVIAEALRQNESLQSLDIADNYIGSEGAAIVGASFRGNVTELRRALGDQVPIKAAETTVSTGSDTGPARGGQKPGSQPTSDS